MIPLFRDPHHRHLLLTLLVGTGLAAYLSGAVEEIYGFNLAMLLALVGGLPIYLDAATELLRGRVSANLAVSLAAAAALYLGQYDPAQYAVAAEVILIMLIGETLEHFAIDHTRSGIADLLALRPHSARVRRGGQECEVHLEEIRHDDVILVRPGDRIPIDGRVLVGDSSIDQSPITGESLPADKGPGDEVFAGTINLYGSLELAVVRLGEDTTLQRIIHLVEEAEAARAPTQRLADRYATWFVPIVLLAAGLTWYFTRDLTRSVAVLVVACPCALVLATPTAIAAGIGRLVRRGVLVKGGAALEQLGRVRAVVFDKTGTLTLARLRIAEVIPAPGYDRAEVLRLAAAVERHSEHPIARLIVESAAEEGIETAEAADFLARPGLGTKATVAGQAVQVGSRRYMESSEIALADPIEARLAECGRGGETMVLVAHDREVIGAITFTDTVRPEAKKAVHRLSHLGVRRIAMLTGDHAAAARTVAEAVGISDVRSDLLPTDKVEAIRQIQREFRPVAMVGDGINDAPSLIAADVGVAMAGIGSDLAINSAGVVLVGDDLHKLADAVDCGRRALRIIWQNILGFAVVFNIVAVVAASLGWVSPVVAAVLHQVSSLTVVLNSLRLLVDGHRWGHRLHKARHALEDHWRPAAATAAAIVLAGYFLSGLHRVRVGEVGVVQQFGKLVEPVESPGLHYRLPYPLATHWIVKPSESRRVEIGFRTVAGEFNEPPAYDWNVQHRGGRSVRQDEEASLWLGDENLADVNLVVHYRVTDPVAALFRLGPLGPQNSTKWDELVRSLAEAGLRAEMSRRTIEAILGEDRASIEEAVLTRVAEHLRQYEVGLSVDRVCLGDIHPPLEVVPAFREVSSSAEEKEAQINEAYAYQAETKALAAGQAKERTLAAEAFQQDRTQKAAGDAERFVRVAEAYHSGPEATRLRLYLETVEQALAGRRKVILDPHTDGARRQLILGPKGIWNPLPAQPDVPPVTTPAEDGSAP